MNDHGLSPPSPVSKAMKTTTKVDGSKDDLSNSKVVEKNPAFVRLRLSQRVLELQEAVAVTSKKVKLQWEVRCLFTYRIIIIRNLSLISTCIFISNLLFYVRVSFRKNHKSYSCVKVIKYFFLVEACFGL